MLLAAWSAAAGGGCSPPSGAAGDARPPLALSAPPPMDSTATRLVGRWHRTDGADCPTPYPAWLELQPNGLYRGTAEPEGSFTTWDVGRWSVEGATLALSTATDAVIRYPFTLDGDRLEVAEPGGCRLRFRREG